MGTFPRSPAAERHWHSRKTGQLCREVERTLSYALAACDDLAAPSAPADGRPATRVASLPNPGRIAFSSNADGDWEIYAIRPDGSGLRRITRIPGNDAHPEWSPDGAWIAFATGKSAFRDEMALHPHNPQSYGDIAVMRADGSNLRVLTDNPWEDATPRWAPAAVATSTK